MPSASNVKIEKASENMGVAPTDTPVACGNTAPDIASLANNNSLQQQQQLPQQQQVPQPPPAQATNNAPMPPLRQAITVIEHKIRNMEKRKSKLESYREVQRSGKDLNADQKSAVAKYDEVVQTLEFARDLCKQFLGIAVVSEKEEKKRLRKEALARNQGELTKIREVLLVQDALSNMVSETVRDDFLQGKNGAASLTQTDLKLLDDLYLVANPKHASGNPSQFMPQVQAAAEHLQAVVDGKPKEAFGSTYSQIKEVIGKIHESGYFDQAMDVSEDCAMSIECPDIVMVPAQIAPIDPIPVQQLENMTMEVRPPPPMQPQIMEQPPPQQPPQMEQQQQQPPPVQMQPVPEAMYYQQPPPPPAPRPITEVLGNGSFFFLQDSELDTPPEQIPTQTFTNQTYVSALPPPIPMPPHFHQFPNAPPQQPPQNVVAPQPMQQVPPPQQQQQQQQPPQQQVPPVQQQQQQQQLHQQQQQQPPMVMQQHVVPPAQTNNGIGERHHPEVHEDMTRQRRQQRGPPTNNHHQPFFPNNNGYNNRPRNNNRNNGPRPNNNRHNQPL